MAVESYEIFSGGDELPEGCIANALSLTSPKDACRLSLVDSTFRSAAESDAVWERFLPPDYGDIISRSINGPDSLPVASKKELYLHLCDHPILIDGGTKSFSLEKWSGKKCYMLAARSLKIVWADTPRYWRWISLPESRFPEVAELLDVCWFDLSGKINTNMLSPDTRYGAYLVFTTKSRTYGFGNQPAESSVGITGHERETQTVYLDPQGGRRHRYQVVPRRLGIFTHHMAHILRHEVDTPYEPEGRYPKQRSDGWMEIELGEFFVKRGQEAEVEMSLTELKGGNWKSGLIVEGIDIRPKEGK
ncbi:PREDICTED: F-box protein PP2-B10-like [Nicotiana attenuata]|uniref:F-box protein n=1 Tax=Nicotiana attenuata TaxID=49451 RepID=A0A314LFJ9_NICAT|nr:PREDICTED: F-box protein PP2-B10-like [Nicotiana attenuata]OIT39799.1 f-box protein [Nicotiana attenuata]